MEFSPATVKAAMAENARLKRENSAAREGERLALEREREAILREERAQKQRRKTTMDECLEFCHTHMQSSLMVERDKSLSTHYKGQDSKKKWYPTRLLEWKDFPEQQERLFSKARDFLHPPSETAQRQFESKDWFESTSERWGSIKIGSEKKLERFQQDAVEIHVASMINALCKIPLARTDLSLGEGVVFQDHKSALSDMTSDVQGALDGLPKLNLYHTPRKDGPNDDVGEQDEDSEQCDRSEEDDCEPEDEDDEIEDENGQPRKPRVLPDQFCIYEDKDERPKLLFLVEYKPPHGLTVDHVVAGFRDMNLKKEVWDRTQKPAKLPKNVREEDLSAEEKTQRLNYYADKLVAAVSTQVFHSMIVYGIEYSYLSTGEAFVFFRILEDDPKTLYYHVSVPLADIEEGPVAISMTAVGQILGLSLMAFTSERRLQPWRKQAKELLEKRRVNFHSILSGIPKSERGVRLNSDYVLRHYEAINRSPYNFRSKPLEDKVNRKTKRQGPQDMPNKILKPRKRDDNDDDDDDEADPSGKRGGGSGGRAPGGTKDKAKNASTNTGNPRQTVNKSGRDSQADAEWVDEEWEAERAIMREFLRHQAENPPPCIEHDLFCTQACLLGVVNGTAIDEKCPNSASHPVTAKGKHMVDANSISDLVRNQLADNVELGCLPMGLEGARGALFKIKLLSHGYVFVAKGTVKAYVPLLEHEACAYMHLKKLQGSVVPVYLGFITLKEKYYLDFHVKIRKMLLMSYGGVCLDSSRKSEAIAWALGSEVQDEGIFHEDLRGPNVLWNEENQRHMLIDFEQVEFLVPEPKPSVPRKKGAPKKTSSAKQNLENPAASISRKRRAPLGDSSGNEVAQETRTKKIKSAPPTVTQAKAGSNTRVLRGREIIMP